MVEECLLKLLHSLGSRIATPSTPESPTAQYAGELEKWRHDRDLLIAAFGQLPPSSLTRRYEAVRYQLKLEELRIVPADKIERFLAELANVPMESRRDSFRLY